MHEGHRDRLRSRFREQGADSLADHELLELLLFFCIPRRDPMPWRTGCCHSLEHCGP